MRDEAENVIEIEAKPEIEYSDFDKLQFQVGEIIACEEVKKSKSCFAPEVRIGRDQTDRIRYQAALYGRRDGREKGDGTDQSEVSKNGRCDIRRHAFMRRGCGRQSGSCGT